MAVLSLYMERKRSDAGAERHISGESGRCIFCGTAADGFYLSVAPGRYLCHNWSVVSLF